jgi:hypothetical protein
MSLRVGRIGRVLLQQLPLPVKTEVQRDKINVSERFSTSVLIHANRAQTSAGTPTCMEDPDY